MWGTPLRKKHDIWSRMSHRQQTVERSGETLVGLQVGGYPPTENHVAFNRLKGNTLILPI